MNKDFLKAVENTKELVKIKSVKDVKKENMPFGANLTCKAFEEAKLFNIAKKLENQTGFANICAKKEEK
jgi:Asp-tRNA(Asn)/Glu-tRNA(Gln) amidotransferase A subunit family amidase